MRTVLYDAGALIAAERRDGRFAALHQRWLTAGVVPVVPPPVLAQVWRSSRQVRLAWLIVGCRPWPMDFSQARAAGQLLAAAGTSDVVDAYVVIAAQRLRPVALVTSDRADIEHLAQAIGLALPIVDI